MLRKFSALLAGCSLVFVSGCVLLLSSSIISLKSPQTKTSGETQKMAIPLPAPAPIPGGGGAAYGQLNAPATYSYKDNGSGGYNYFLGTNPITNTQFGAGTGIDYGSLEKQAMDSYNAANPSSSTPAPTPTDTSGGGTSTNTQATAQAAAIARAQQALDLQHQGIEDSVSQAEGVSGDTYRNSILDYMDKLKAGQMGVDNQAVQAELAKKQGMDSIRQNVGDQIRGSSVFLGNRNAGNSSAADALARAYSLLGMRQAQQVGSQYGVAENNVGLAQNALSVGNTIQGRKNEEDKQTAVNSIVGDATNRLSYLNSQLASASVPERIDLEGEKARIISETKAALEQYDHLFTEGVAGVNPSDQNSRVAKANELATSGVAASSPFNFTTAAPAQLQGTGGSDFGSNLPLFTLPRKQLA